MDSKFYVSLEAARLLKEKGYNEDCEYAYNEINMQIERMGANANCISDYCSAPTKAEAIDWLEDKELVIEINSVRNRRWRFSLYKLGKFYIDSWIHDRLDFSTRLEAEEAAIIKALELL